MKLSKGRASVVRELLKEALHASLSHPVLGSANFLNEVISRFPEAISFAPGRPFEEFFDSKQVFHYLESYIRYLETERGCTAEEVRRILFQYGPTNGHIRELVARTLEKDENIRVGPESIVVTVGCQEGMFIVLRSLHRDPRDVILVPSPCYIGLTGAARLLDIDMVPVEDGTDGLDLDGLVRTVRATRAAGRRPRAFYVVPDFSNPSGNTLDIASRLTLLDIAGTEDFLILEDNPYGFFDRQGQRRPSLKSLDTTERVIVLGSFAKSCFPGARVGYVVADQAVVDDDGHTTRLADELSMIKSMLTVNTPSISQAVIGGMLIESNFRLLEASADKIAFYANNLNVLLDGLEQHFPAETRAATGVRWNSPAGGFFVVLRAPFPVDEKLLEISAREYGVIWTPMSYFYVDGGGEYAMRLSCSYLTPQEIDEGLRRLARLLRERVELSEADYWALD